MKQPSSDSLAHDKKIQNAQINIFYIQLKTEISKTKIYLKHMDRFGSPKISYKDLSSKQKILKMRRRKVFDGCWLKKKPQRSLYFSVFYIISNTAHYHSHYSTTFLLLFSNLWAYINPTFLMDPMLLALTLCIFLFNLPCFNYICYIK